MSHITSIGAGVYTDFSVSAAASAGVINDTVQDAVFVTEDTGYFRIKNIREFPPIGTPANIVNVPVFGKATSDQVQGQADAPNMEFQINYVPADWAVALQALVGNGLQYTFRFAVMNSKPTGTGTSQFDSSAAGINTVENTYFYFKGKLEALLINPQLTDANTATLTVSVQSDFAGPYTAPAV